MRGATASMQIWALFITLSSCVVRVAYVTSRSGVQPFRRKSANKTVTAPLLETRMRTFRNDIPAF